MNTPIKFGGFTIIGESMAGHHSAIYIRELRLCFDMGKITHSEMYNASTILISHGHNDHIGALSSHSKIRRLRRHPKPRYVMPSYCMKNFDRLYLCVSSMDRAEIEVTDYIYNGLHYDLVSTESLNTCKVKVKDKYWIRSVLLNHSIDNYGYVIFEEKKKLKEEYRGLSGKELGALRKAGTIITESINVPMIAYTGDTRLDAVVADDSFMNASILIMECSFIDDNVSITEARKRGHTHLDEIIANRDKFANKCIILFHFSASYKPDYIQRIVNEKMSCCPELHEKVKLLL